MFCSSNCSVGFRVSLFVKIVLIACVFFCNINMLLLSYACMSDYAHCALMCIFGAVNTHVLCGCCYAPYSFIHSFHSFTFLFFFFFSFLSPLSLPLFVRACVHACVRASVCVCESERQRDRQRMVPCDLLLICSREL